MFFKHRFFLSTIAFFCTTAYSSPHDCLSLSSWIHFSLRTTAYPSPHDCLSLSGWIHFPSPYGFISPLHMDSFLLSAWIHFPSLHDCLLLSTQNILSFFGISNKHENGKYISLLIIVTVSTLHHSKQSYGYQPTRRT